MEAETIDTEGENKDGKARVVPGTRRVEDNLSDLKAQVSLTLFKNVPVANSSSLTMSKVVNLVTCVCIKRMGQTYIRQCYSSFEGHMLSLNSTFSSVISLASTCMA